MKNKLLLLTLALAPLALLQASDAPRSASKPNILFVLADDWAYGHAGVYGCKWVKTPTMDRVAREGLLFNSAYTPCGKCAPSRAAILTGRNPWQLKAAANHWCYFPPEFKSLPEALGEHGYFTGMTGKGWSPGVAVTDAGQQRKMTGRPFNKRTAMPVTSGISSNDYAANFTDFLDAAPKDNPWFFWFGCWEPHRAYEYGSGAAKGGMKTSDIDRVPGYWPDNEAVRMDMLDYAFETQHFDQHLGRMLAELEKRGMLSNTLIVVTADNGMPFPHAKGYAYHTSVHEPLAIMWKDHIRKPGRVVEDYVSFIDFAPTFLQVAGVPWKQTGMSPLTGQSLMDILDSETAGQITPQRDHVLIGKERNDIGRPNDAGYPIRGIIKGGMLYVHNFETDRWPGGNPETGYLDTDGSPTKTEVLKARRIPDQKQYWELCFGKLPADQLFDLRKDPDCVSNLAATVSFDALQRQLFEELKKQGDPRLTGNASVFDTYPCASPEVRNVYDKIMRGEKVKLFWVNESDFEPQR
ncbi:MAG: sulfatase [bacterium]